MKVLLLLPLLFAIPAAAQDASGSYQGAAWQINEHHTLVWGGTPYLPVGAEIDGNAAEVARVNQAGVKDIIVDLPASGAAWTDTFAALNQNQDRFLVRLNSLAPMATGVAVEPQGYRIPGITEARHVSFPIPDATSALVLVVDQRDGTLVKTKRVSISNGQFVYDVPSINGLEHVLLVYPILTSSEQPDFWERFDVHRDTLLSSLQRNAPGAGLRGFVNPIGKLMRMPGRDSRFVPTSPIFRAEMRALLEGRYRSVETAIRAWTVAAPDFNSFEVLARLVPLWSGYRGVPSLWDPETDRIYTVDNKRSTAWRDINDAILAAATRRFKSLVSSIRAITDVPVIQEWAGWAPPYDGSAISIDGVGVAPSGSSPNKLIASGARGVSSVLRWNRPGWLIATDLAIPASQDGVRPAQAISLLSDMGIRGFFSKQPLDSALDASLAATSPAPLFFPENATNPPIPQRLPGGKWWLPSPASGDRIDFGSKFAGYRLVDGSDKFLAIWSTSGTQRVPLRLIDLKAPTFETLDGSDPNPKVIKNGIEITIGDAPMLVRNTDEIPVPDPAVSETIDQFTSLLKALGYERGAVSEEQYYFALSARGFDRNPGGSLFAMRSVLAKALMKVAPYTWIEAESSKAHNFSTLTADPGCSLRGSLDIDSSIAPPGGFVANYDIPVRSKADQEIWVAARVPEAYRDAVTILVAGQSFTLPAESVSPYGDGFAWYKLGMTRLGGAQTTLKVIVNAAEGAEMAFDCFVISPTPFMPNGVQMPMVKKVDVDPSDRSQFSPLPPR